MAVKKLASWIQQGWTLFVDPDREKRLDHQVAAMHKELAAKKKEFDLIACATRLEIPHEEIVEVTGRLFRKCLSQAWSDDELTEKEQRSLSWIASSLRISSHEYQSLQRAEASRVFAKQLAAAFADGNLDDAEFASLTRVAESCGTTPADFLRSEFRLEGEAFVRNLFIKVWEDGRMDAAEYALITSTLQRLGMSITDFRQAIRAPAIQLVEHLLAEFKCDGVISPDEENLLEWMLANLVDDGDTAQYVRHTVAATKRMAAIRSGILPSLPIPKGVVLRAGEIVHYSSPCRHRFLKRRGDAMVPIEVFGLGVITDDQFLFVSTEQSLRLIHSKVLGFQKSRGGIEININGKGSGGYFFSEDAESGAEIWLAAIGKANQTIVMPEKNAEARYIPRDIRQRVWQRYGGRCADCNATQYLEFDHIIPVAKGGGNSENNIQLLCRGCNSKKSDAI